MGEVISSKIMNMPKLGQDPPSRVLLWRWGGNPTTRGTFWLTKDNAKKIIDNFNQRGNPLVFDVDHRAFDKKAEIEQKVAVGFAASLLLDNQGLWADNMVWNELGTKLIKMGGFVFDSPVTINSVQNAITDLIAGSITNFPAKNNAQPLLFSTGDITTMDEELMSKVKPLREMQFALGAILNSLQKTMELYNSGDIDELCKSMGSQIPDWSMALSKFVDTVDPEGKTLPADEETESEEEKKIEIEVPIQNTAQKDEVITLSSETVEVQEDVSVLKASILALNDNNKILEESLDALRREAETLKKQSKIDRGIIDHKIPVAEKEKFMTFSDAALDAYLQLKRPIINMFSEISQPKEEIKTVEQTLAEKDTNEIFSKVRR